MHRDPVQERRHLPERQRDLYVRERLEWGHVHRPDDVYIERLLGLKLAHDQVQRGNTFIAGVVVSESPFSHQVRGFR